MFKHNIKKIGKLKILNLLTGLIDCISENGKGYRDKLCNALSIERLIYSRTRGKLFWSNLSFKSTVICLPIPLQPQQIISNCCCTASKEVIHCHINEKNHGSYIMKIASRIAILQLVYNGTAYEQVNTLRKPLQKEDKLYWNDNWINLLKPGCGCRLKSVLAWNNLCKQI